MGLRCSSSVVRPPPLGPMRILNTIAVLELRLRISPVTAPSRPARIEPTPTMVPTPMITPSTVRNERTLFSRNVESARPTTDRRSFIIFIPSLTVGVLLECRRRVVLTPNPDCEGGDALAFRPQGDDGIEARCSSCGINPEEQPDGSRKRHP